MIEGSTPRWRFESAMTALDELDFYIARDRTEATDVDFITNRPWVIAQREPGEGFDDDGMQVADIKLRVQAGTIVTQTWLKTVERVMQSAGFAAGIVNGSVMLFAPQFTWSIPASVHDQIKEHANQVGITPAAAALGGYGDS